MLRDLIPRVSVIIPTYNRSCRVKEAIESVLQQSYTDFEVLVIDDGSTDYTRSVVKRFSDERIRYFYKDNGGQSSARNLGLIKARGDYVAYLDEDDLWLSGYLENIVRQLDTKEDYGATYTRVIESYPNSRKREMGISERNESGWITQYFFEFSPCLMPSATCFRKSVWKDVFWDEALKRCPDYDVFLRVSTKTQFLFVPDTYVIKRWYPDNLSSLKDPIGFIDKAHTLERFYFQLGGNKYVTHKRASRKISRAYRKAGKISMALGDKRAAVLFFKKAISYYPMDLRLYINLMRILLKKIQIENIPDWHMPEPLSPHVTVTQKH